LREAAVGLRISALLLREATAGAAHIIAIVNIAPVGRGTKHIAEETTAAGLRSAGVSSGCIGARLVVAASGAAIVHAAPSATAACIR
jgi:hypothetical protein